MLASPSVGMGSNCGLTSPGLVSMCMLSLHRWITPFIDRSPKSSGSYQIFRPTSNGRVHPVTSVEKLVVELLSSVYSDVLLTRLPRDMAGPDTTCLVMLAR